MTKRLYNSPDSSLFEDLFGEIIIHIADVGSGEGMEFTLLNGLKCRLIHYQECCESVTLEDTCGEIKDLLNSPILLAEEAMGPKDPPKMVRKYESETWTFYKLATIKGTVTFRWWGTSNGCYSETLDFEAQKYCKRCGKLTYHKKRYLADGIYSRCTYCRF